MIIELLRAKGFDLRRRAQSGRTGNHENTNCANAAASSDNNAPSGEKRYGVSAMLPAMLRRGH
jgi:hypothetical protein